jgi:hypothetical protein
MTPIDRTDHETRLGIVPVERAPGDRCTECHKRPAVLLRFYTGMGAKRRDHEGMFCSKLCHDVFHGLAPRAKG